MQITIRNPNLRLSQVIRDQIERQLRFALGRFAHRIDEIAVTLTDANGSRGGPDKHCQLAIRLRPRGLVLIEELGVDPRSTVDRAADRAALAVGRAVQRKTDRRTVGARRRELVAALAQLEV